MFFADIPGHSEVKASLIHSAQSERIPHAQIVLGKNGGGHLPLTLAYIAYIMCLDRSETDSCGRCAACVKTHKLIHPDIHFAFPVIGIKSKLRKDVTSNDFLTEWRATLSNHPYLTMDTWMNTLNSENKQADINVKECIDIIKKLGLKTFESDFKIMVLWMPEFLGKEGNRLLKLIEEPTDNTFIIMVAEDQQKILNTILSRCQLTYVKSLTIADVKTYLIDHHQVDDTIADRIARASDGNIGKAIELIESDSVAYDQYLLDWLRVAYKGDPVASKKFVEELAGWSKQVQKTFLDYGILFFREYMFTLTTGIPSNKLSPHELETVEQMRKIIDLAKAESMINVLSEGIDNISRNLNPRIMLMSDTLTIGQILKSKEKMVTLYKI